MIACDKLLTGTQAMGKNYQSILWLSVGATKMVFFRGMRCTHEHGGDFATQEMSQSR
jgi:hypothetical protein